MTVSLDQPRRLRCAPVLHRPPRQCGKHTDHRFGVIVTNRLTRAYCIRMDWPYPVAILREGARVADAYHEVVTAFTPDELHAWMCAWSIPSVADLHTYIHPTTIITADGIHPNHRMHPLIP